MADDRNVAHAEETEPPKKLDKKTVYIVVGFLVGLVLLVGLNMN